MDIELTLLGLTSSKATPKPHVFPVRIQELGMRFVHDVIDARRYQRPNKLTSWNKEAQWGFSCCAYSQIDPGPMQQKRFLYDYGSYKDTWYYLHAPTGSLHNTCDKVPVAETEVTGVAEIHAENEGCRWAICWRTLDKAKIFFFRRRTNIYVVIRRAHTI